MQVQGLSHSDWQDLAYDWPQSLHLHTDFFEFLQYRTVAVVAGVTRIPEAQGLVRMGGLGNRPTTATRMSGKRDSVTEARVYIYQLLRS